jgi:hypothetical protein
LFVLAGAALACGITTVTPTTPTAGGAITVGQELAQIDQMLGQYMNSSFAYNSPSNMKLDESVTIELLLNPAMTTEQMGEQIQQSGAVTTGTIEITPQMKAQLVAQDPEAFVIRPLHDDAVQVVSGSDTTRWAWIVTAKKSGTQKLNLVIYRLIKYDGQDSWREVRSYQSKIEIEVTFAQRLAFMDWKWIAGIVVTALLIPAFWRYMDNRKKKGKSRSK